MRKFIFSCLLTAFVLSGTVYSLIPACAEPSEASQPLLIAQGELDLPGDLPGAGGTSNSGGSSPQTQTRGSYSDGRNDAPPPASSSGSQYRDRPSYSPPPRDSGYTRQTYGTVNAANVPPDIGDAPPPYAESPSHARQQDQIISRITPRITEPGQVIIPPDFDRRPLVGIIKLDQKGFISRESVKLADSAQFNSSSILADPDRITVPGLSNKLSPHQLQALLDIPEVILSSRYAAAIFNCQRVLLLPPKSGSGYYGIEVNLRTLGKRRLNSSHNNSEAEAVSDLLGQVLKNSGSDNIPVVAAQNSYKFHRSGAAHLPKNTPQQKYATIAAARQAGLDPCPLCFPETEYQSAYNSRAASVPDGLPLSQHPQMVERLSAVAVQLAYANHLSPQTYRVFLLDDPDYHAFAYVGGPILISDGLLNILDSPGEVASIVSHEMAHLQLGHVTLKPQSKQGSGNSNNDKKRGGSVLGSMASSALSSVVAYSTGSYWAGWGTRKAIDIGQKVKIKFPKHHEEAADREAVIMCFKAGYSPEDFVLTVNKIGSLYQQHTDNDWLIEHRKTEDRLNNIRDLVGRLGAMEVDLHSWEQDDPTLCVAWRQQVRKYLDNPQRFQDFSAAYRAVQGKKPPAARDY